MAAAPPFDEHLRAWLNAHRVGREEVGDDLDARRLADLDQRLADRDHRLALAQPLQDHAADRRDDLDGAAGRSGRLQARARQLAARTRLRDTANSAALRASSAVATAVSAASRLSAAIAPAFINCLLPLQRRPRAHQFRGGPVALARCAWPTAARAASTAASSSPRVRGSSSGASAVVSRATIVLPRTTAIARLELDALQPSGHRRRHDELVAHPRLAVLVERDLHRLRARPWRALTSIDSGHIAMATMPGR